MYYTTIIAASLLVISPMCALPFILYDMYRQHRGGFVLFAIFLGLVAFLMPPFEDLFRHTRDYFRMAHYASLASVPLHSDDFLVQYFSYFLYTYGIKYPVCRLLLSFIEMMILTKIFYELTLSEESGLIRCKLFVILFCSFNFIVAVLGVRHGFSVCLWTLGCYLLYYKQRFVPAVLLFILAPCVHFFFLSLSIMAIVVYILPIKDMPLKLYIVLCFLSLLIGFAVSSVIINSLYEDQVGYLSGQWGDGYVASTKGMIFFYIKRLWIIPLFWVFVTGKKIENRVRMLIYLIFLCFLLTFRLATISGRFVDVLTMLLAIYFILNYKYVPERILNLVLTMAIMYMLSNVYAQRNMLFNANIAHFSEMWKPLPLLLQHDYDKQWTYQHIDVMGDIKNRYKNE